MLDYWRRLYAIILRCKFANVLHKEYQADYYGLMATPNALGRYFKSKKKKKLQQARRRSLSCGIELRPREQSQ